MPKTTDLNKRKILIIQPRPPYNFDANFHKPSHFPSSDNFWEEGRYWMTMIWKTKSLGLKLEDKGSVDRPKIKLTIYSEKTLSKCLVDEIINEIRWRFNLDSDISEFSKRFGKDKVLGHVIMKWRGVKPIAANSLYENLVIYIVLQNATVRRSVQMLENLFERFGRKVRFDGKVLSTFWEPRKMSGSSESELGELKLGYRAKSLMKITEQFVNGGIDEFGLRRLGKDDIRREMLKLYGIGPASVEYLLFEDFYFLDALETIPPWEQKIMSRLLFGKNLVPVEKILGFFRERFKGWEKLAFHYVWEYVFWKRKHEHIEWLEKEIRL